MKGKYQRLYEELILRDSISKKDLSKVGDILRAVKDIGIGDKDMTAFIKLASNASNENIKQASEYLKGLTKPKSSDIDIVKKMLK